MRLDLESSGMAALLLLLGWAFLAVDVLGKDIVDARYLVRQVNLCWLLLLGTIALAATLYFVVFSFRDGQSCMLYISLCCKRNSQKEVRLLCSLQVLLFWVAWIKESNSYNEKMSQTGDQFWSTQKSPAAMANNHQRSLMNSPQ